MTRGNTILERIFFDRKREIWGIWGNSSNGGEVYGERDGQTTVKNLGKRVYISGHLSGLEGVSSKPGHRH
jgi:hypothetical protein